MVDTRVFQAVTALQDLCETYSTEGYRLHQVETGITYGSSVIDVIEGFNGDKPYSRYTYVETEEYPEEPLDDEEE